MNSTTEQRLAMLPDEYRDALRRSANETLMVAWINADLLNRAACDVKRSVILYDDAGIFAYALDSLPDTAVQARLLRETSVRYWSKGI